MIDTSKYIYSYDSVIEAFEDISTWIDKATSSKVNSLL